ncbi:MAG: hypothetical protein J1F36_01605 [Clostridiales bacterium]|nr:hypothetical protein [Clostridiales bacterium]
MKLKFAVSIILIMLAAMCLCACGDDGNSEVMSDKEQSKIISAIANRYEVEEDRVSFKFYGKYNGAFVLMVYNGFYAQALWGETVDGVVFNFPEIRHFEVYKSGKFYRLQEAFDNGWVDHDDLLTIKYRWDNDNPCLKYNHN